MKILSDQSLYPQSASGITTAMLIGALALTSVVEGLEMSIAASAAPVQDARLTRTQRALCEECGVVTNSRRMARPDGETTTADVAHYEVAVRMRDGSIRTFIETSSVHWRAGERIILIETAVQSIN